MDAIISVLMYKNPISNIVQIYIIEKLKFRFNTHFFVYLNIVINLNENVKFKFWFNTF